MVSTIEYTTEILTEILVSGKIENISNFSIFADNPTCRLQHTYHRIWKTNGTVVVRKPAIQAPKPDTPALKPGTVAPKPRTPALKPGTVERKPGILELRPVMEPSPDTLKVKLGILIMVLCEYFFFYYDFLYHKTGLFLGSISIWTNSLCDLQNKCKMIVISMDSYCKIAIST